MMGNRLNGVAVVHVRFDGRSVEIPQADLDVGLVTSDADVKRAVAQHLAVPADQLGDYIVDRHPTGNLTIRPEAVFG